MIGKLRSNAKKYHWTLWAVIFAFVGGFVAVDAFRGDKADAKSELVYIDNQVAIRGLEFHRELTRVLENYRSQFKNNFNKSMIAQMGVPEQILRGMLYKLIIKKEAEKMDITVSDDEVKAKILSQFQRDGKFVGLEIYQRTLAQNRMEVTEFEDQLREDIMREKLEELVAGSLTLDPTSLQAEFKKDRDKVEMDLITLRPDRVKEQINVEDKDVMDFYANHKEDFKSSEKRSGYVIAFKFDDFKKEVSIDENEMRTYFNTNKSEFVIPGKTKVSRIFFKYDAANREEIAKKADSILKELTKENFAAKSIEISEDPKAKTGGDYGYTDWQNFSAQELSLIDSMGPNSISPSIDTQRGFSILLVSDKVKEIVPVFNDVKLKIKDIIEQEKLNQKAMEKLQSISGKLEKAENIKVKAGEMGLKAIETDAIANGQGIKNLDEMGYISRKLFSLKEKEIASPVQFDKGLAIVQLAKIVKPMQEPFENVKDLVKEKALTAKKVDMLKIEATDIASELAKISDAKLVEEFLKGKNLNAQAITYKRGNKLSNLPVKKGLDDMLFSMEVNRFSSPIAYDSEVAIVKVKSKTITSPVDFEKEKEKFYTEKVKDMRRSFFASYMENMMNTYKITSNARLLQETVDDVLKRF